MPLALRPVTTRRYSGRGAVPELDSGDQDGDFETTVERLISALDTDLEWERQHSRLTVKALEWEQAARNRSFLLRGADLQSRRALAYGRSGQRSRVRRRSRPSTWSPHVGPPRAGSAAWSITSLAVAAISIGLLIFALISRGDAISQALTSDAERVGAQAVAENNLDLAMLYAVAAVKLQNRLETPQRPAHGAPKQPRRDPSAAALANEIRVAGG